MSTVTVKIENAYSDGHTSRREVIVEAPAGTDDAELVAWFNDVVYEHTGDGHGVAGLGSCYTAEIVSADTPELLGEWFEWV